MDPKKLLKQKYTVYPNLAFAMKRRKLRGRWFYISHKITDKIMEKSINYTKVIEK